MAREIVAPSFGNPDVLKTVMTSPRSPGKGEVEIRVQAAGVNHVDYSLYSNLDYMKSHGESAPPFPLTKASEAHWLFAKGGAGGRMVLLPDKADG